MKTIGAKIEDPFFEKCEIVRRQEGLSRSNYVRAALEAYNILHYVRWLTDEGLPVKIMREPDDRRQEESPSGLNTYVIDRNPRDDEMVRKESKEMTEPGPRSHDTI